MHAPFLFNGNAFLNIVILYYLLMRRDVWFANHLVGNLRVVLPSLRVKLLHRYLFRIEKVEKYFLRVSNPTCYSCLGTQISVREILFRVLLVSSWMRLILPLVIRVAPPPGVSDQCMVIIGRVSDQCMVTIRRVSNEVHDKEVIGELGGTCISGWISSS